MTRRSLRLLLGGGALLLLPLVMTAQDSKLAPAPKGFDAKRDGIERGKVETVEYDSKSLDTKRKMVIYTPPGYAKDNKYPVFYLLHGAGGNESNWTKAGSAGVILDNLLADKKIVPMIVVMPNGSPGSSKDKGKGFGDQKGFE